MSTARPPERYRALVILLAGILALVLLGQAVVAVVGVLPPRIEYVGQDRVMVNGWAVEWTVTMRVGGHEVVATFYSEAEQMRLLDEIGGKR